MFLGNTSINAFSNTLTLSDNGNSTCKGGTLNGTAYWAPALLDMSTKKPIIPKDSIFYYKEGYNGLSGVGFQSLPEGLGMVGRKYSWSCSEMTGEKFDHIPSCPKGARLSVTIDFPQCWDGINLWLADESHTSLTKNRACPTTHPIPLPQISLNFRFEVEYAGQTDHLMLASDMHGNTPGTSAHADWVNGWNKDTSDTRIQVITAI